MRFEWADPPAVDLCWSEFAWMADSLNGGAEIFSEMPKISPRVLSIEIVPGVSCQLRLASTTAGNSEVEPQQSSHAVDPELQHILLQITNLATKARSYIGSPSRSSLPIQQSLDLPGEAVYKNARPKKGKRT
jgi:hypothetical protein